MKRIIRRTVFCIVALTILISCEQEKPFAIYLIGDSTMSTYDESRYPLTGWGQALSTSFLDEVTVRNHAKSGRSTKSFIDQGLWKVVYDSLKAGDYVFIQFGHNDEKKYDTTLYAAPHTLYKQNLIKFVNESQSKGAKPVLFTSIARRVFDENGILVETHGEYPLAVIQIADQLGVTLVDMNRLTSDYLQEVGDEESKSIYCWVQPNKNYPEGKEDNTHLSDIGAKIYARMAMEFLSEQDPNIARHLIRELD